MWAFIGLSCARSADSRKISHAENREIQATVTLAELIPDASMGLYYPRARSCLLGPDTRTERPTDRPGRT